MKKIGKTISNLFGLRSDGQKKPLVGSGASGETERIIEELCMHQIELETKNEELRRLKQELETSQKKYSDLYDLAPVGYFTVSEEGMIQEVNQVGASLLGIAKNDLVGEPFTDFICKESLPDFFSHRSDLLKTRTRQSCELKMLSKNGSEFHALLECIMVKNAENNIIQFRTAVSDISKRKEAEDARSKLETRILHTRKFDTLNMMADSIAHNLNNLLTGILGNLQLAERYMEPGSPGSKNIENAEKAVQQAAELSRMILTQVNDEKKNERTVDMTDIVGEITSLLKVAVSEKAQLFFQPEGKSALFKGVPSHIHHVLINLVTNAAEAIDNGKGKITMSTGTAFCRRSDFQPPFDENMSDGDYVFARVSDNGCGMDPETRSKAFEPFFTTRTAGRGLGLSTVLGIVRSHKGTVSLSSSPGKGTEVTVFFPALSQPDEPGIETPKEQKPWQGSGTVLLVDDEQSIREVGLEFLLKLGFNVLTAEDGDEAVEIFREKHKEIDCVILDIVMPRMGGKETFYELKSIRRDIPVIFCSGISEEKVTHYFDDGVPALYIAKPFLLSKLAEKLKEVLNP
jgi:PAS domain S-box-containing protein